MAIESLFGASVADVQELRRQQAERDIAGAGQEFGVFAPLYQAGLRFGNQAVGGINTLMGIQDPMLKKATDMQAVLSKYQGQDFGSSAVLGQIAGDLASMGYARESISLADDIARLKREERALIPKSQLKEVGGKLLSVSPEGTVTELYTAPEKEKDLTPQNRAEQDYLNSLYAKYPQTVEGRAQAADEFATWKSSFRQREAAAGVPQSGEVKISDLAGATKLVGDLTAAPKDKLDTVKTAKTFLDQAKKGEGAALPQLKRQLVKLVGDSQIGQGEVRDALGSSGIVGDTINAVNQFMTGIPTQDKLNSVEQVINALENINAQSYNQGRERAINLLGEAKLSEQTRKTLIPPPYKTATERKASQFVEGRVYQDANGNRARYVNGKWVPVQ